MDQAEPDRLLVPDGSATPGDSGLLSTHGENKNFSHVRKIRKDFETAKKKEEKLTKWAKMGRLKRLGRPGAVCHSSLRGLVKAVAISSLSKTFANRRDPHVASLLGMTRKKRLRSSGQRVGGERVKREIREFKGG